MEVCGDRGAYGRGASCWGWYHGQLGGRFDDHVRERDWGRRERDEEGWAGRRRDVWHMAGSRSTFNCSESETTSKETVARVKVISSISDRRRPYAKKVKEDRKLIEDILVRDSRPVYRGGRSAHFGRDFLRPKSGRIDKEKRRYGSDLRLKEAFHACVTWLNRTRTTG